MEVAGQACACCASQVQANIESLGVERPAIDTRQARKLLLAFQLLVTGKRLEVAHMTLRGDEQMAVVIWDAVEDDDREWPTIGDE
jgi:hypothetical protein